MFYRYLLTAVVTLGLMAGALRAAEPPKSEDLRQRIERLETLIATQQKLIETLADMQDMKRRLTELEQRMDAAQGKPKERVATSPAATGTIRLQNRLSLTATFLVDGVPYRVQPGVTQDLVRDAGAFTFEVLLEGFGSIQPQTNRTLQPGQVYNIFTFLQ